MLPQKKQKTDHWSAEKYKNAAGFVPQLTTKVVEYLSPQPNDNILDIGCGDGQLTSVIAKSVSGSGRVLGLDASGSFVASAKQNNTATNCSYELQDCADLETCTSVDGSWDKVFSNAAMHWILRKPDIRRAFFHNIMQALKPGGRFVFEMGGKGNVAEIHAAFTAALVTHGVPLSQAREASPWFFPSTDWMREALEDADFEVEICESEYRPTKLTADNKDGSGGIEGWVRLMGAQFLEAVAEDKRDAVVRDVCDWIETVIQREEDGSRWIGYVRCRAVGRRALKE
jgi:trans-aconitate methyltransferase